MTDRLWTLDSVTVAGRGRPRLDRVSLAIPAGVTAVVGESGAGKTTLLNLLVGYERTTGGRVSKGDPASVAISGACAGLRRSRGSALDGARLDLFWVPQDDGLWPRVSARRHLELVSPLELRDRIGGTLAEFDLGHLAAATPDRLSRGEASRLSLARAIASDAAVLVLDEPLAHVDPARRSKYWELLLGHARSRHVSLVFASHEPADVLRYADHAIGVHDGEIVFEGPVRSLYESPPSEDAAALLGPTNWLDDAQRAEWGLTDAAESFSIRPERLRIEPSADGAATVVQTRSGGSVDESELMSQSVGGTRLFLHRPASTPLAAGTRVRLCVLALFACLGICGCLPTGEGPTLEVASERSFSLPAKGTDIPAPRNVANGLNDEKVILDNAGRVLVYDAAGKLTRQWDMPESSVGNPEGCCVLRDGRVVVADTHYHRVVIFDGNGKVLGMFGELGRGPGQFIYPVAVIDDPAGNLYVAEYGENDRIQKFGPHGEHLGSFGSFGAGEGQFQRPSGLVWLDGKLFVADAFNNRIHVFKDSGESLGLLGAADLGLHYPYDLAVGPEGNLYVIEYGSGRLTVLSTAGRIVAQFGKAGHGRGQFATPWGLAVDAAGRVWVADTGNRRVVELVPAGSPAAERPSGGAT